MKIVYRVMRNQWFDDKPDLTEGIETFNDPVTALTESHRLNATVVEGENVQYNVQAIDYWK